MEKAHRSSFQATKAAGVGTPAFWKEQRGCCVVTARGSDGILGWKVSKIRIAGSGCGTWQGIWIWFWGQWDGVVHSVGRAPIWELQKGKRERSVMHMKALPRPRGKTAMTAATMLAWSGEKCMDSRDNLKVEWVRLGVTWVVREERRNTFSALVWQRI